MHRQEVYDSTHPSRGKQSATITRYADRFTVLSECWNSLSYVYPNSVQENRDYESTNVILGPP